MFLRDRAWPILSGVADWAVSRVTHSERGYEIRAAMGIAERETECQIASKRDPLSRPIPTLGA
jgi:protein-glucosylgalactosylhydroxylysine glucosidase